MLWKQLLRGASLDAQGMELQLLERCEQKGVAAQGSSSGNSLPGSRGEHTNSVATQTVTK